QGVGASRPLAPTWIAVPPRLRVTGRTIRAYLQPLGARAAARFATRDARRRRWPRSQTSRRASSTQSCWAREAESGRSQCSYPRLIDCLTSALPFDYHQPGEPRRPADLSCTARVSLIGRISFEVNWLRCCRADARNVWGSQGRRPVRLTFLVAR